MAQFPISEPVPRAIDGVNPSAWRSPSLASVVFVSLAAWLALGLCSPGGLRVAVAILAAAAVLFGSGQSLLWCFGGRAGRGAGSTLLALPVGLTVFAGLAQMAHHLGFPAWSCWVLAIVLALPGLGLACCQLRGIWFVPVSYGWLYLAAIVLVGLVYYLPKSQQDSVHSADGGMCWIYPDSAFHEAIVAVLPLAAPLRNPGLYSHEFAYHYGRHALAGWLVALFALTEGDSLARVLHMLGLAAVVLGGIRLGQASARTPQEKPLAGLMAVFLLFFLPNLTTVFMNQGDSCSRHPQGILPRSAATNELSRAVADSHLDHFLSGGSTLWAAVVALCVAALLSRQNEGAVETEDEFPVLPLVLSIFGIALNGVAGLACAAVVAGSALWSHRNWRGLAFAVAAVAFLRAGQYFTGLSHAESIAWVGPGGMVFALIRGALCAFFLLISFRGLCLLQFAWGTRQSKTALLLFLVANFGLYEVFFLQGYPLQILAVLLSGYAAAPLAAIIESLRSGGPSWSQAWAAVMLCFKRYSLGLLILAAVLLPPAWYPLLRHRGLEAIYGFSVLLPGVLFVTAGLYVFLARAVKTAWTPRPRGTAAIGCLLFLLSAAGTVRAELNWVLDYLGNSTALDAGRVRSLEFVRDCPELGSLAATTHHDIETASLPERSYGYAALSRRCMLLEGWRYGCAEDSPLLKEVMEDNGRLFATHDAGEARAIAAKYGVTHILLEPGQSLGFDVASSPWLRAVPNPGTLTILAVQGAAMADR
jgi:hypothetical protein